MASLNLTGAKAPSPAEYVHEPFTDSDGNPAIAAWCRISGRTEDERPTFSFQVYISSDCIDDIDALPSKLLRLEGSYQYEFQTYTLPMPDVFACIQHYETEQALRGRRTRRMVWDDALGDG